MVIDLLFVNKQFSPPWQSSRVVKQTSINYINWPPNLDKVDRKSTLLHIIDKTMGNHVRLLRLRCHIKVFEC